MVTADEFCIQFRQILILRERVDRQRGEFVCQDSH